MDMKDYISERGVENTIADIARLGPVGILKRLGPAESECHRLVAQSAAAFTEVEVSLANGHIRRDFKVRDALLALLQREGERGKRCTVEGEDFRWQWVAIEDGAYRWRLRTYEGESAAEGLEYERRRRKREGEAALDADEEATYFEAVLVSETFEQWRHELAEDRAWPRSVAAH